MDRGGARQLPLEFAHAPGLSRDDLVVSQANAEAVAFVEQWPAWPSPVVILAGPAGSGKSHLGAIWREISGARLVSAQNIGQPNEAIEATAALIDGVDDGKLDEVGLFHLINAVRGAQSTLLITARSFPSAWRVTLPDLASRLKAASVVEIHEPDDELLAGVMTKLFADRQVEVEPHVIQYLVKRMERSLLTANSIVERLDRAALEQKSRITRALAAEIVSALDAGQAELDL